MYCSEVCDVKFSDVNVRNEWTETPCSFKVTRITDARRRQKLLGRLPDYQIMEYCLMGLTLFWVMKTALHEMTIVKLILSSYNW